MSNGQPFADRAAHPGECRPQVPMTGADVAAYAARAPLEDEYSSALMRGRMMSSGAGADNDRAAKGVALPVVDGVDDPL